MEHRPRGTSEPGYVTTAGRAVNRATGVRGWAGRFAVRATGSPENPACSGKDAAVKFDQFVKEIRTRAGYAELLR